MVLSKSEDIAQLQLLIGHLLVCNEQLVKRAEASEAAIEAERQGIAEKMAAMEQSHQRQLRELQSTMEDSVQSLQAQLTEAARVTMQIRSDEVKQVCERLEASATQAMTTMEVRTAAAEAGVQARFDALDKQ